MSLQFDQLKERYLFAGQLTFLSRPIPIVEKQFLTPSLRLKNDPLVN